MIHLMAELIAGGSHFSFHSAHPSPTPTLHTSQFDLSERSDRADDNLWFVSGYSTKQIK